MINKGVKRFCCESITLIENYEKAVSDESQMWHCHHRLEIQGEKIANIKELINNGLYYNRPASELIFITQKEHKSIHLAARNRINNKRNIGVKFSLERRTKISMALKGRTLSEEHIQKMKKPQIKHKWLTPSGEIEYMPVPTAKRWHPDWKLVKEEN